MGVHCRTGIIALRLVLVSNAPSTRIRPAAEIYDSGESMALENFSKPFMTFSFIV